ncbi:MAG: hypothetical protein AB2745_18195 [Candidatus Thiodiazotropha endolucinida]
MELAFETVSLRQLCENESVAVEKLGEEVAVNLKHRLADLRAADNPLELPVGNPKTLNGQYAGMYSIDVSKDVTIIFKPNHVSLPKTDSDETDWSHVFRIKIINIGECNV